MDATCWKVVGGMGTAMVSLAVVIRYLYLKLEVARQEIVDLHKQRIRELEEFKRMVEGKKP
jgi:uncharacterized membrane protein